MSEQEYPEIPHPKVDFYKKGPPKPEPEDLDKFVEDCRLPYKTDGYYEPYGDGSGRVRRWTAKGDREHDGYWVVDFPPDHEIHDFRKKNRTPHHCPICHEYMARNKDEASRAFRLYGCCHKCVVDFVEGFEEEWKEGWRPEQEQVDLWLSKRKNHKYF